MAKKIIWTALARADVRGIDRETAIRLLESLARFVYTEQGDVSRLTDIEPPEYRLRIGDYRVRFYDHGHSIEILRVRNRREAYRLIDSHEDLPHGGWTAVAMPCRKAAFASVTRGAPLAPGSCRPAGCTIPGYALF